MVKGTRWIPKTRPSKTLILAAVVVVLLCAMYVARRAKGSKEAFCKNQVTGTDRPGGDMVGMPIQPVADANACCNLCDTKTGCQSWAYDTSGSKRCWLKSSRPREASNSSRTSGTVCSVSGSTDFYGGDLRNSLESNAGQCCMKCKSEPDCYAWTYVSSSSKCHRKRQTWDTTKKGLTGYTSGTLRNRCAGACVPKSTTITYSAPTTTISGFSSTKGVYITFYRDPNVSSLTDGYEEPRTIIWKDSNGTSHTCYPVAVHDEDYPNDYYKIVRFRKNSSSPWMYGHVQDKCGYGCLGEGQGYLIDIHKQGWSAFGCSDGWCSYNPSGGAQVQIGPRYKPSAWPSYP